MTEPTTAAGAQAAQATPANPTSPATPASPTTLTNAATPTTPTVLTVTHSTTYHYSTPVETAQHLATIRPQACPWQEIVARRECIEPAPSYQRARHDAFGNEVLYFSLESPHRSLRLLSETTVALHPRWAGLDPATTPPWDEVADSMRYRVGATFMPETEFCFTSPNIGLGLKLRDYGLQSFAPGRPLAEGAIDLMHRIHRDFRYRPNTTAFDTPAHVAFALRSGVCQDFAQVMIGCLRALGLPARYVSGYLRNDPPPGHEKLIGADASHAWVSVYCPGSGWIDLDPTNDMLADLDHITLALGRDYSDVSLVRGLILGGGAHRVDVAVTVTAGIPTHKAAEKAATKAPPPLTATPASPQTAPSGSR